MVPLGCDVADVLVEVHREVLLCEGERQKRGSQRLLEENYNKRVPLGTW